MTSSRDRQQQGQRARSLGWVSPSGLPPGRMNALTDVPGVRVGYTTMIRDLVAEGGPPRSIRTGITAILPHAGNLLVDNVRAAVAVHNGYGKATGLHQVRETGRLETPILLTNTLSVWRAADALLDWVLDRYVAGADIEIRSINPVVLECNDGYLNDILGRHLSKEDVWRALDTAGRGPVGEGNVGGGTGTRAFGLKAGIGTSSRTVGLDDKTCTLGVLVQANFGRMGQLRIRGFPAGEFLAAQASDTDEAAGSDDLGSCIMVLATDAPLSSRQLGRLARRAPLGLARLGATTAPNSGEFTLAFATGRASTANMDDQSSAFEQLTQAVVEATEESVLNSLTAAADMVGHLGRRATKIPTRAISAWLSPLAD